MLRKFIPSITDIHSEKWHTLSHREKLRVLQAVEDVYASKCGRPKRIVKIDKTLDDFTSAQYRRERPGFIYIKENYLTDNGLGVGYRAMYSIIHEGYHAFQDDCTKGIANTSMFLTSDKVELWRKNFDVYNDANSYNTSFSAYRFQPLESDAYDFADKQMVNVYELFCDDPHYLKSIDGLKANKVIYAARAVEELGDDYKRKITNEIIEPKINGIDKNSKIVAPYIGCLTIPYKPVSTTF